MMEDGTRKRGLFLDLSEEPAAKAARMANPEYLVAFQAFDADRSGFIDLGELSQALQAVKRGVESSSPSAAAASPLLFPRQFQMATCCWLCARFGDGARLSQSQFCELLAYVVNARNIFEQVDVDRSGTIECGELYNAFQRSGLELSVELVTQIGRSYDADNSGKLEFDEFLQLRLEWDTYITAWDRVTSGAAVMHPDMLYKVLEEVKQRVEPVGVTMQSQAGSSAFFLQGLIFTSMFKNPRPFHETTLLWLIVRFGGGNLSLTFAQYATMMVFLKETKVAFCKCDTDSSGSLNVGELANVFASAGMALPAELVVQLGQAFDRDGSGAIEFDEFLQMAVEWSELLQEQVRVEALGRRASAADLQELLGKVRVVYPTQHGGVLALQTFSRRSCRLLTALFGTPQPGETCALGLLWNDVLTATQYLKVAYRKFHAYPTVQQSGMAGVQELQAELASQGVPQEIAGAILKAHLEGMAGAMDFDQFVQVLVECQLYDRVFARQSQQSALPGGAVALDKAAFFAMAYAVPRAL